MQLKPQDVLVSLKLAALRGAPWTYASLAEQLGMSPSEVHAATKRAVRAGLLLQDRQPNTAALLEFLTHGVRYAFPLERGPITRGMPTAHGAPPLSEVISGGDQPPVWPDPHGEARGESVAPLYRSAVHAARGDAALYRLLALVDALRGGRARERALAQRFLKDDLKHVAKEPESAPG